MYVPESPSVYVVLFLYLCKCISLYFFVCSCVLFVVCELMAEQSLRELLKKKNFTQGYKGLEVKERHDRSSPDGIRHTVGELHIDCNLILLKGYFKSGERPDFF